MANHKKKLPWVERAIKDVRFNRNLVNDYTRNVGNYLQTRIGPNEKPLRIIKPREKGPTYEDGTPVGAYYRHDTDQVSINPRDRKYESKDALPNTGHLLNTLGHEFGHQNSEYQLSDNNKTMAYLKEFSKIRPPDKGKLTEVRDTMKKRKGYRPMGNLPGPEEWNPGYPVHSQPLEKYAMEYGNAIFKGGLDKLGGMSELVPGRTHSPYALMWGGLDEDVTRRLQSQRVLPPGNVDAEAVDGSSRRDALMGSEYSQEKRRVQRQLNARPYRTDARLGGLRPLRFGRKRPTPNG